MSELKKGIKEQARDRDSTIALETRVDVRTLAELAQFWISRGETKFTRSWLIRLSLEAFTDILKQNGMIEEYVMSVEDAVELLQSTGFKDILAHRGGRRIQAAIQKDYGMDSTGKELMRTTGRTSSLEIEVARAAQQLIRERQLEEAKKQGFAPEADGGGEKRVLSQEELLQRNREMIEEMERKMR